eukprot:16449624-Heterocapsa_arctica.AAC.1
MPLASDTRAPPATQRARWHEACTAQCLLVAIQHAVVLKHIANRISPNVHEFGEGAPIFSGQTKFGHGV